MIDSENKYKPPKEIEIGYFCSVVPATLQAFHDGRINLQFIIERDVSKHNALRARFMSGKHTHNFNTNEQKEGSRWIELRKLEPTWSYTFDRTDYYFTVCSFIDSQNITEVSKQGYKSRIVVVHDNNLNWVELVQADAVEGKESEYLKWMIEQRSIRNASLSQFGTFEEMKIISESEI